MGSAQTETSVLVCETVAESIDEPVETLPPLSDVIDPDGLNAIVTDDPNHDVTVSFSYAGKRVIVHSRSTVYVRPISGEEQSHPDTPV